mmetsp:Transcript_38890/g.50912  ORF Transcript_38890/g.50912 Transcript_38890/m.50912 type:complete len:231 (+) Transcript_38890:50-742(+)
MTQFELDILVKEGRSAVSNGLFPSEILEQVKDKQKRKWLFDAIFSSHYRHISNKMSETEKLRRGKLLSVEMAFEHYMKSMQVFRFNALMLVAIGIIMITFELIRPMNGLAFGMITLIESSVVVLVSLNQKYIRKYGLLLFNALVASSVIEIAFFQFPIPVFYGSNVDVTSRLEGFWQIFNGLSPFIYIAAKFGILISIAFSSDRVRKFIQRKADYEATDANTSDCEVQKD